MQQKGYHSKDNNKLKCMNRCRWSTGVYWCYI